MPRWFFLPLTLLLTACATAPAPSRLPGAAWPDVTIAAFTDVHVYDTALGTSGAAWDALQAESFELFAQSASLLSDEVDRLVTERPGVVLISGDLTKDGERASHELVARLLHPLRAAGIPVLVIPGNHDVLNPQAFGYTGAKPEKVPAITPADFASIYADYGFASALERDPASLSYLAEPVPGLRVLALDTARYEENASQGRQVTGGRIRAASWPWIERMLAQAQRDGVPVAVLMHHALVEKFDGQARLFRNYVVADQSDVQNRLARGGVRVAFTGHFHSLSAASVETRWGPLLDIEDGTLAQYPLGSRRVAVENQILAVSTVFLSERSDYGDDRIRVQDHLGARIRSMLTQYALPRDDAGRLAEPLVTAYLALVSGDPVRPVDWVWPPAGLGPLGALGAALPGLLFATDPSRVWGPSPPADLTFALVLR